MNSNGSDDEFDTVYFFNANFKINKNLIEKINEEFADECKKDLNNFMDDEQYTVCNGQNMMIFQGTKNFTINDDSLFTWDNKGIEMYEFKKLFSDENKKALNFKISQKEKFNFIKSVYTASNSD